MSSVIIYSPKTNKPMYQITILPFNTMVTRLSDAATTIVHDNFQKLLLVASCDINNAEDASKAVAVHACIIFVMNMFSQAPLIVSAVLGNYPEVVDILVNEGASIVQSFLSFVGYSLHIFLLSHRSLSGPFQMFHVQQ